MGLVLLLIKCVVFLWDLLTYPIYQMIYRPWERRKAMRRSRSKCLVEYTTDDRVIFEAPEKYNHLYEQFIQSGARTLDEIWTWTVQLYRRKPLLGTREILAIEDEVQSNGKMFKKYHLGDYRWITYEEANRTADEFGRGLRTLGVRSKDKICIFADTRAEWLLSALGCFKQGFTVVTLYTNLGEAAIEHGLNQTRVSHVITSHELLPKFRTILKRTPTVTYLIYFEHQVEGTDRTGYPENINLIPFYDVVQAGHKKIKRDGGEDEVPVSPSANDPAIIMYTSGSTGSPKGVILSHRNIVNTVTSLLLSLDDTLEDDTYLGYLPLAHVLELASECVMIMVGARIGYSSPFTMTDKSTMVKKGMKGDAAVLRPTIVAAVPLILDRIYKAITETVNRKGSGFQRIFRWAYEYRLEALRNGDSTPLLNMTVFHTIRALLGGKVKYMISGGAPLSPETHNFIRVCMGAPVLQGYGLTETTACATLMEVSEITRVSTVGPPNQGVQIKLINWEEGNYRVTDKPLPRGEIVVGGPTIADGYYEMEEKTKEDFYTLNGRRWFKTGDIGQMEADGTLKIIDRKKDLVKLQFGEYVSLGKVEACLKTNAVIENVCVYGDSFKSYCVAIVSPDPKNLVEVASKYKDKNHLTFEQMCDDRDITGAVLRELVNHGKKFKLEKFEIPGAVTLVKEKWLPETGFVTAAFKLKRKPLQEKYQADIDRMYGSGPKT